MGGDGSWGFPYLGNAVISARWAAEATDDAAAWQDFTPDQRDRYVQRIDDAVTALRRVRTAMLAREWRECAACDARFVGVASARYCSPACKQRAYRLRQSA